MQCPPVRRIFKRSRAFRSAIIRWLACDYFAAFMRHPAWVLQQPFRLVGIPMKRQHWRIVQDVLSLMFCWDIVKITVSHVEMGQEQEIKNGKTTLTRRNSLIKMKSKIMPHKGILLYRCRIFYGWGNLQNSCLIFKRFRQLPGISLVFWYEEKNYVCSFTANIKTTSWKFSLLWEEIEFGVLQFHIRSVDFVANNVQLKRDWRWAVCNTIKHGRKFWHSSEISIWKLHDVLDLCLLQQSKKQSLITQQTTIFFLVANSPTSWQFSCLFQIFHLT